MDLCMTHAMVGRELITRSCVTLADCITESTQELTLGSYYNAVPYCDSCMLLYLVENNRAGCA